MRTGERNHAVVLHYPFHIVQELHRPAGSQEHEHSPLPCRADGFQRARRYGFGLERTDGAVHVQENRLYLI